jgi:hypothetical protein
LPFAQLSLGERTFKSSFRLLILPSRARLSEPAAEDRDPGRSTHRKTCDSLVAPAGRLLRGPAATVSHLMPTFLPIRRDARAPSNSLGRRPLSAPPLVNLVTVADHEQVRNLPMPGKWPQRRACVPDRSRKRDRPVVTIAAARDVEAGTEVVSGRIAKDLSCCPRHP